MLTLAPCRFTAGSMCDHIMLIGGQPTFYLSVSTSGHNGTTGSNTQRTETNRNLHLGIVAGTLTKEQAPDPRSS